MNGPLIITIIILIKALECTESEVAQTNETKIEKDINAEEDGHTQEISTFINQLQQQCHCPCKDIPRSAVCGKTTSGQLKTFDSQCHLICHNQCGSLERYAVILNQECPHISITNRKNVYSHIDDNRRTDLVSSPYTSIITPLEWQCDCSYCPETRWIRFDYYPICAERGGQKVTFESWCHFDCENKCVKHTGYIYLYLYKGPCEQDIQQEYIDEILIPRDYAVTSPQPCEACSVRCKDYFEPVCAKNSKDEYFSFKSRCHMRCHIQCYQETNESYSEVYDGHCPWL